MVKQSARLLAKGYYDSKGNRKVFYNTTEKPREDNVIKSRSSKNKSNSCSFMNDYVFSGWKMFYWLSFVLCIFLLIFTWTHRDVVSDLIRTFFGWGLRPIVKMCPWPI